MFGGGGMKGLGRAGAAAALALLGFALPCDNSVADELPGWIYWDDAYWAVSGAEEAAALVANTQAVAEAHAIVTQVTVGNVVTETDVIHTAVMQDSFNGNAGLIAANQSTGSSNNQANVHAFAMTPGFGTLQDAQADVLMEMHDNTVTTSGGSVTASIDHSFNNTTGVVAVNQAAGSLNQQVNVLALSLGNTAGMDSIILDDATLALVGTPDQNTANEDPTRPQTATTTDSFNDFTGIGQVNQVAGNLNRVNNVMAISVMAMP